ncbi:TPA: CDP-diacylglycerol--serine O-phosphatidyltransferase [Candidatus Dependentiae bacterium]|nr:MAG: CDP-diacylglycerol-serine O-phosphatidyltransferase [candidate division TM6 bacterium GW2011_GWE2_31_21]KKP53511.1 MAG: CDP-diacylglycerol-serine O-phosphatidyltransferase [candidate division TM6 bacterium GW2011_GWF2_33_332]HBS48248.1 CDP-diacylglycerol--serine O-phosphatidyltransferase [Candidatus Dependentiae bacterium]HBZ73674.1 CDP-diacylglycerol--serine O-phosphatidyltransferase [Candidatus Dependentiae bacterium]
MNEKNWRRKLLKQKVENLYRSRKILLREGISVLPHIFTLGNVFFGFVSIIFSAKGQWEAACYSIFLGAMMDSLDGRIARYVGSSSNFGMQLDSLADTITFCLAPAFLAYNWHLYKIGYLGFIAAAFFLFAGVLRLARFNLISDQQTIYFLGLPTTMAASLLIATMLNAHYLKNFNFAAILTFFTFNLACLMVSLVKFPTFKKKFFWFQKRWQKTVFTAFFVIFSILRFDLFLFLLLISYLIGSIIYAIFEKVKFAKERSKVLEISEYRK